MKLQLKDANINLGCGLAMRVIMRFDDLKEVTIAEVLAYLTSLTKR